MQLSFELKSESPKDFHPNYDDLLNHTLGSIKPNTKPAEQEFPFNPQTKNWQLKIIFDDYKCIQGICNIPTRNNTEIESPSTGSKNYIPLTFVISKIPAAGRKKPVVWHSPFIKKMTQANFKSINTFFNNKYDFLIEETRKHKVTIAHNG